MKDMFSVSLEIATCYDLTTILTTMITCTATFAAIIGGLIANKAITVSSEKEAIDRQLQQINAELKIKETELVGLYEWIDSYNAREFIHDHLEELLAKTPLENVYDHDNENDIEYEELLPYWEKAIIAFEKFYKEVDSERNNDDIPKVIINELDAFQYRLCSLYHNSFNDGRVSLFDKMILPDVYKQRRQYYNENADKIVELKRECEILSTKKAILQERYEVVSISKDIKNGMKIFSAVAFFNIILPMFFLLYNPTSNKYWYYIETAISFTAFIGGIGIMVHYIFSLFPNNSEKDDKKGAE